MDKIYARLPVWGQHVAVTAFGVYWFRMRFGPGYKDSLQAYLERDCYTAAQWQAWQDARLKELLLSAACHVSYYRETWTEAQKTAARDGDLAALPLLDKEPLRADPTRFARDDVQPRQLMKLATSGSTGTPITVLWTAREYRDGRAMREARSARWAGVSFDEPRGTFSGRIVEPDPASKGPFYRYNAVEKQAYFSAFHLRPDTAALYVRAIKRHRLRWLTGYAVSYYLLACLILEQNLAVPNCLKAIITTSEKVTPEMRAVMEKAFRCRVYEEYSTVENALFVSECEHGRLHSSPDVAVVEILRPNGTPCDPGEVGEVVTTCLMRGYQPFIRFRLGDMASWDDVPCPCGRSMPVIKEVAGRMEDVVVGPDGRVMVRFHGIFVNQPHVREGQIVQETRRRLRVRVVALPGFGPADEADIIARVMQRMGEGIEVIVEPVEVLERTKAGKFKAVVSHLTDAERVGPVS